MLTNESLLYIVTMIIYCNYKKDIMVMNFTCKYVKVMKMCGKYA